jgi:hypothetical protein
MTPFTFSGVLAGLSSIAFGSFVFFASKNKRIGRTWLVFTISVAVWGFGGMWIGIAKNPVDGLTAWRVAYAFGVVWIGVTFYHFVSAFLGDSNSKTIRIHYLVGVFFALNVFSSAFFSHARFIFNSVYYARGGYLYPFFFLWWFALVVYSHLRLLRAYKSVTADVRNQIKYFFFGTAVGFAGGSTAYLPNFGIDVYPWGNFTVCLYPVIMAFAIVKHRLMDINVIIRRTLTYSIVTGTLTAIYLGTVALFAHLFEGVTGYQTVFSSAVAAGLITFCFQPLRKRVQTFIDVRFFRQYVDREEKLYELSREVITHTTTEAMAEALMRVLVETLHPKSGALFVRTRDGRAFAAMSPWGETRLPTPMAEDNPLANYFKDHPQPFVQETPTDLGSSRSTRAPKSVTRLERA